MTTVSVGICVYINVDVMISLRFWLIAGNKIIFCYWKKELYTVSGYILSHFLQTLQGHRNQGELVLGIDESFQKDENAIISRSPCKSRLGRGKETVF